jgi:hypothetical protein
MPAYYGKPPLTVHEDPTYPNDKMLMGYKGGSFLDAGFIFDSYVDPEPSAIDRLAALADDEIREWVEAWDKRNKLTTWVPSL